MSSSTVKPLSSGTMTFGVARRDRILTSVHDIFTIISIMYISYKIYWSSYIFIYSISVVNGVHHKTEVDPKMLLY